jgi:uncharacterized membrane protein YgdD (TMEM256/DUF423 family)
MTIIQQESSNPLKTLAYWLGVALVIGSALSLIYIAIMVIQLIQSPEESKLIVWIGVNFKDSIMLFSGQINEVPIEFRGNDKLQFLLLSILGLIAITILGGVLKALLMAGIELIKFSKSDLNTPQN